MYGYTDGIRYADVDGNPDCNSYCEWDAVGHADSNEHSDSHEHGNPDLRGLGHAALFAGSDVELVGFCPA